MTRCKVLWKIDSAVRWMFSTCSGVRSPRLMAVVDPFPSVSGFQTNRNRSKRMDGVNQLAKKVVCVYLSTPIALNLSPVAYSNKIPIKHLVLDVLTRHKNNLLLLNLWMLFPISSNPLPQDIAILDMSLYTIHIRLIVSLSLTLHTSSKTFVFNAHLGINLSFSFAFERCADDRC